MARCRDTIFATKADAERQIAINVQSIDPGEFTYRVVAAAAGWVIEVRKRNGDFLCNI